MRSLINILLIMAMLGWSIPQTFGQPSDPLEILLQKLKAADAGNYQRVLADIVQQQQDMDFDTAKAQLEYILQVTRKFSYKNALSDVFRKLGDLHRKHHLYADSYTYYEEALQVAETYALAYEQAKAKDALGALLLEQFKFEEGIIYFLESADLFSQGGYLSETQEVYLGMGNAYYHGRDFYNAIRYYKASLYANPNLNGLRARMWACNSLGLAYNHVNGLDSALTYYAKALEVAHILSDSIYIGLVSGNSGIVYMRRGNYAKAIENLHRDVQLSSQHGEWVSAAGAMVSLAEIYQKTGEAPLSNLYLDSAMAIAQQQDNSALMSNIYEAYVHQYQQQQDYQKAFEYLSQVMQLRDSLHSQIQTQRAAEIDAAYNFDKNLAEIDYLQDNNKLQRTVIGVFSVATLMLFIFSFVLSKLISHRTQANQALALQKQEIEQRNTALQIQKDKSAQQNSALEIANEKISVLNKKLEQKVRFSEEILRSAYENASEAYFIMRAVKDRKKVKDFVCLDVNRAAERLLNLSKEELLGERIRSILPFVENNGQFDTLTKVFEETVDFEKDIYLGEGGKFPAWVQMTANQIEGGIAIRVKNISNRKEAEVALRESEQRLRTVINNIPIILWTTNKDGIFTMSEGKALEKLALHPGKVVGLSVFDLYADNNGQIKVLHNALQKGITYESTDNIGNTIFNSKVFPLRNEQEEIVGLIGMSIDITERVVYEEKLKQQHQEIIKTNKKIAEYQLMALRSMMNPHFLFNSLNSIQFFIAKNEREQALNYLSLFSKLIRGVLNSSVNSTITLAQELEILKYYVELESLRFENKFETEFVISDHVDIENLEIPSLLIQPYVENAIIHGLYNKDGCGKLTISLSQHKDLLQCVVADNGVGRKEALRIKKQNTIRHKSVGMIVTQERLDIINKTNKVSVKIQDMQDKKGHPFGTSVEILIQI